MDGFDELVPKRQRFVIEYCGRANCNASRAAQLAGYTGNAQTLGATGSILLKDAKVRAAISRRFEQLQMPAEENVARLTEMARLDVAPLLEIDSTTGQVRVVLTQDKLEATYGRVIREIDVDPLTQRVTKIKFHDALAANRDIAKIRGLFSDAPVLPSIHVYLEQLSDADLLARLEAARPSVAPVGVRWTDASRWNGNGNGVGHGNGDGVGANGTGPEIAEDGGAVDEVDG